MWQLAIIIAPVRVKLVRTAPEPEICPHCSLDRMDQAPKKVASINV